MNAIKRGKTYRNLGSVKMHMDFEKFKRMTKDYMQKQMRTPPFDLAQKPIEIERFEEAESFVWLGHSTILVRINGLTVIVDPMLSKRASPVSFAGPKRFEGTLVSLETLPKIDLILITHNHYDHLDHETIMALHEEVEHIFVPLDNAKILTKWGVDATKIKEFDWFHEQSYKGVLFALCPTQHFSGRNLHDRDTYLWGSWVIKSETTSVYVSGDSGYNTHFKGIGEQYGPFDVACLECGAYNESWKEVHMLPEESVQASMDLKAKVMLPMHWGGFNLSTHAWDEPITRALIEAQRSNVTTTTPMIGEVVAFNEPVVIKKWWKNVVDE